MPGENIGELTAHLRLSGHQLAGDMARAKAQFRGMENTVGRSMATMRTSVLSLQSAIAGLGIGLLAKEIMSLGMEFEQTMRTVQGVMRAAEGQYKELEAAARRMGETTEWTANQAAESLKFLGMAGFEADKAIEALPGTLDLATAGAIDLGRAADISTNALTAMGLGVDELTRVGDTFIGTITRTNTNMDMMAESFKYAAPVAKGFGISVEELSAMIGTLGNAGVQGSMAGTQLRMAFTLATKAFEHYGESAYNADGTTKSFVDALKLLNERGADTQTMLDIFGQRAGLAALILKENIPFYEELAEKLRNADGEMKTLADRMRNTTAGAFRELKSALEGVALDIFAQEASDAEDAIRSLTNFVRENKGEWADMAGDVAALTKNVVSLFASIAQGWANLPQIVQETGLLVALFGGKAGVAFAAQALAVGIAIDEVIRKPMEAANDWWLKWGAGYSNEELQRARELSNMSWGELWTRMSSSDEELDRMKGMANSRDISLDPAIRAAQINASRAKFNEVDKGAVTGGGKGGEDPNWLSRGEELVWMQQRRAGDGGLAEARKIIKNQQAFRDKLYEINATADQKEIDMWLAKNTAIEESTNELTDGLVRGFKDYATEAGKLSDQLANAVEFGMKGMEDAILQFTETGKFSFRDMANSIISDLMRITIRSSITGPLAGALARVFSGPTYNVRGYSSSGVWTGAKGGAFGHDGVMAFAQGGIVSQPTLFPFAKGTGLMGEAGEEGILPLARMNNGVLGVHAVGGGGGDITINVYGGGDADVRTSQGGGGFNIDVLVGEAMVRDIDRNGPGTQKLTKTFNLKRSGRIG